MKTSRQDVTRNKRKVFLPNSPYLGYSSMYLKYGDHFLYRETYTDGTFKYRFAKCHGQIKPNYRETNTPEWYILAQTANQIMSHTFERWINPVDVVETRDREHVDSNIEAFFKAHEEN